MRLIYKIPCLSLIGLVIAPFAAFASSANVSFVTDTPIVMTGPSIDLTVQAGSLADTFTVGTSTITVALNATSSLRLVNPLGGQLVNTAGVDPCHLVGSENEVTFTGPLASFTITPNATVCTAAHGGGGGGGSSPTVSTTPTISLLIPGSGSVTAGSNVAVNWTLGGSGIKSVDLLYSTDGGSHFTTIMTNVSPTGPYAWAVPSTLTSSVILRAIGRDSGGASLSTAQIALTVVAPVVIPPSLSDLQQGITRDVEGRRVAPSSGQSGLSPLTGLDEAVSKVVPGEYIRSYGYNAVYLVTDAGTRRPFWNPTTFFTWATSFDQVVWVTDATLATMPLGTPMLPQPGVVLVKVQSESSVYEVAVDPDGVYTMHLLPSEALASSRYGAQWADYVIDLEPTFLSHYRLGSPQTDTTSQDLTQMLTRSQITARSEVGS